jgi:transmembrane sensor
MKGKNGIGNGYGEEKAQRIAWLISGYLRQTLTEKEHDELDQWVTESENNQKLFEELVNPVRLSKGISELNETKTQDALKRIRAKLEFTPTKATHRKYFAFAIAATFLLMTALYFIYSLIKPQQPAVSRALTTDSLQPGGNYATLRMEDGRTVNLSEIRTGLIDSNGGVEVLKTAEGQLSYEGSRIANPKRHILTTPVGGQYSVLLPDGTRVWLNALSSLSYPTVFNGRERVVEMTGEAYFEVAAQSSVEEPEEKVPFVVIINGARVEVLGTHFNINAYEDEPAIKTTLLEGKIKIDEHFLQPGEQAETDRKGNTVIRKIRDTDPMIAWKNGLFQFEFASIEEIMRQLGRWYDAEILYGGKIDYHFTATIQRNEPVTKILGVLEATNNVRFTIEGKKITIHPKKP